MTTEAQMVMEILQSKDLIQVDEIMGILTLHFYLLFVWCSEKCSKQCELNYTILHFLFSQNRIFPVIFQSVFTKCISKGKTGVKRTLCET